MAAASPTSPKFSKAKHAGEVDGIPIAAKFKGPGPVYSLPPTIGVDAKQVTHRAPAFSFGVKISGRNASIGPGPAAFCLTNQGKGPSFSLQGGFKKVRSDGRAVIFGAHPHAGEPSEVDLDNPGPARYQVSTPASTGARAPAFTITSRPPDEKSIATPGPAAYRPPSTVGARQIAVRSSPAPTIAPSRHSKRESLSPGPAAYQPVDPSKLRTQPAAYSLGRRWDKDTETQNAKLIPGPGAYNPTLRTKNSAPVYSFRQKHSEYEHFVTDSGADNALVL